MLVQCALSDSLVLCEVHEDTMKEDFQRMNNGVPNYTGEEITSLDINDLLLATESLLSSNNKTNANFMLQSPNYEIAAAYVLNKGEVDPNSRDH